MDRMKSRDKDNGFRVSGTKTNGYETRIEDIFHLYNVMSYHTVQSLSIVQ